MTEQMIVIPRAIEGKMHGEVTIDNCGISLAKMADGDEVTIHFRAYDSAPINDSDLTVKHRWTGWFRRQWRRYRLERR